jgi:type IV pilus assembly protein PilC
MLYSYTAINPRGQTVRGTLQARSVEEVEEHLASRELIPQEIKQRSRLSAAFSREGLAVRFSRVKAQELILFSKQFRTMFKAGISIMEIFRTLNSQSENKKLQAIAAQMQEDIQEGSSLHACFAKHPNVFSNLYSSMIQAGEISGSLPDVMDRLIYLLDHEHKVKSDIKSALQYPIIVLIALGVAFFILLTFVIPKFASIFKSAGLDLPLPTVLAIGLYNFLADFWFLLLPGLIGLVLGLVWYTRTDQGRYYLHTLLLRLPVIGDVMQKAAMSRFASIFAILQTSGITALNSLAILSSTIGNAAISREFDTIQELLIEGRGISEPLRSSRYFPPMVVNMVAVGEQAGNLDEMLREISSHYDDEVEYAVSQMSGNLGPVLIVGLAAVVGFFALAIFLPMWDLTQMVR